MDTDGHDPSLRTPNRLAGSLMARDLENRRIYRIMSLQRVGKVGGLSRSDTDGPDPSAIVSDCERQKKKQMHDWSDIFAED